MSVVETITQELAQARCQHCGELAFGVSEGAAALLDDVQPDERAAWKVVMRAEEVRRVQPAHPQPALDSARALEVNRLQEVRQAQADHDEAVRAEGELSFMSRREKREAAQRALQGATVRLERAQEEHAAARAALERERKVERVRAAYDAKHDELYRQASTIREELYGGSTASPAWPAPARICLACTSDRHWSPAWARTGPAHRLTCGSAARWRAIGARF